MPERPREDKRRDSEGDQILRDVYAFVRRFVAYPSEETAVAHVLWIAHTHLMDAWDSTPRIAFLSPEPASGKTRALEVTELLVPNPVESVNVSPAYLFRKVAAEAGPPTLLFDEIDTVFGPKAKDNEEVRGLLNAGHRRGAVAGRCVVRGQNVQTEELSAYCAVAMAGLGFLPDTILTRSVIVNMRRRAPMEAIEPFRRKVELAAGEALRGRLARWASKIRNKVAGTFPDMPDGIADRDADVWEALLAVADAAGGEWPQRARVTAVTLVTRARRGEGSLGIRLLGDIKTVFADRETLFSKQLLQGLINMDESIWADLKGRDLTDRGLALRLRAYEVHSKLIREGDRVGRGYVREDFHDAWLRYLPSLPTEDVTSVTPLQNGPDYSPDLDPFAVLKSPALKLQGGPLMTEQTADSRLGLVIARLEGQSEEPVVKRADGKS